MDKVTFRLWATVWCLWLSVAAWAADNINIVFIGNSITYGATLSSPATEAPPVRVREILSGRMANRVCIANCGHSGSTTLDWLPGTAFFNEARTQATRLQAQGGVLWFSLMLGTNDSAITGPNGSPVSTIKYQANMRSIIDQLIKEFPEARFIVNYPIWYSPNTHNGATYLQEGLDRLKSYHAVINVIGKAYSSKGAAVYLGSTEPYSFFENNTKYFTPEGGYDGTFYLHPNKEGAVRLAEFWAQSIELHSQDVIDTVSTKYLSLLAEAQACYDRAFSYKPIVTQASQLSSNSITMQGQLPSLIDGHLAQNLQTWPEYGPDQYCYLQARVDLDTPQRLYLGYTVPSGGYPDDYPADVKVQQSADGLTWTDCARLSLAADEASAGTWVYSPVFTTAPGAKHLRCTTMRNSGSRAGDHHFAVGEFNIFYEDQEHSFYYQNADTQAAADSLLKAIHTYSDILDHGLPTTADTDHLRQAIDRLAAYYQAADRLALLCDSALDYTPQVYVASDGLIKRLAQIKTNASGNDNPYIAHNLENMFDRNINTVYQTWPSYPADDYAYLQFDLSQTPLTAFCVSFAPYQSQIYGVPDLPAAVRFMLSADGGSTWAETIDYTFSLAPNFSLADVYTSPFITASTEFTTLRMQMIRHQADRPSGHPKLFGMSEFQIYGLDPESPSTDPTVMQHYRALQSQLSLASQRLESNTASPDDVAQLELSINNLHQALADYADQLLGLHPSTTDPTPQLAHRATHHSIHTLGGTTLAEPQPGLNIIDGKLVNIPTHGRRLNNIHAHSHNH